MDADQFRRAAHSAVEEIVQYYETIQERRVLSNVAPGYLRQILPPGPPEQGQPWNDIQADIESKIMPGLTHWQSPRFMAYFPASTTYPSMLGELYSAAFTAPAFNWLCSPAVTELETIVLDWLARLMKLPPCFLSEGEGGGVIQGSASEAIVTVMVAARERAVNAGCEGLEGEEREEKKALTRGRLIALGTEESHSATAKAAIIAGVRYKAISLRMENNLALTGEGLQAALDECNERGLEPFYLTTTLGTTSTCATDRFDEIKTLAKSYPLLWIHVDAAYAGAALICEEYQHFAEHFDAFNSFDVNMHKWLFTNFDASCLYVKNRRDLTSTFSITPSYLRNRLSSSGLVTDYRDWQIPLGRRFRSLKIWFVLRTYGTASLKAHIRKTIGLGMLFHSLLCSRPDLFRIVTPPAFALTVFTVLPRKSSAMPIKNRITARKLAHESSTILEEQSQQKQITQEVYESINNAGQIYLTSTEVKGVYAIRVVSANAQASEAYVRKAFATIVVTAEKVVQKHSDA